MNFMCWTAAWNEFIRLSQFFSATVLMQQQEGPEKFIPEWEFKPSELCDAGAVLYQLSYQGIWELIHIIDQLPVDLIA